MLRESRPEIVRALPSNFVYEHPTVTALARYLSDAVQRMHEHAGDDIKLKRDELFSLVNKYTRNIAMPSRTESTDRAGEYAVLLTGSTGSLGSNILARLLSNNNVSKVYAISRPSIDGLDPMKRHMHAFEREGLLLDLLFSAKLHFLEGDASQPALGLKPTVYSKVIVV